MHCRFGYTGEPEGKYSTSLLWKLLQFSHRLKFQPVYHILPFLRAVLLCEYESGQLGSALGLQRVVPVLTGYFQFNCFSLE